MVMTFIRWVFKCDIGIVSQFGFAIWIMRNAQDGWKSSSPQAASQWSHWTRLIIMAVCNGWGFEKDSFKIIIPTFCLVMSKLEALFTDSEFNLSQWKSTSFLPAFSICFILILALIIFLSSPLNLMYIQKRGLKKDKARFKMTIREG